MLFAQEALVPSPASPCNEEEHLDEDLQAVQAVPVVISPPSAVLDRSTDLRHTADAAGL